MRFHDSQDRTSRTAFDAPETGGFPGVTADGLVRTVAQVVENGARGAVLRAERQSACSSCHAAKGCGVSGLSKLFSNKGLQFRVDEISGARPGDWYEIGIAQSALLKAALVVYLSPLGGLLAGAILASQSGLTDGWIALAAAAGLGAGLLAARVLALSSHLVAATAPRVLGPLPARAMPAGSCNVAG